MSLIEYSKSHEELLAKLQSEQMIAREAAEYCAVAIEEFKQRYNAEACRKAKYKDWRHALRLAWANGWDDQIPHPASGGNLRYLRNHFGRLWLAKQGGAA